MKVKKSESGAGGEIYNKCQWREIMKIRTGANQRINEGEKRKKKKKKPQPASQSSEMGNESKHGKFVNDAKDGNS